MNGIFTPENPLFVPHNEQALSEMEKHIQATIGSQLNINLTARRSNKLRDLTCVLAGFPGGYQQLKKHWGNQSQCTDQKGPLFDLLLNALINDAKALELVSTDNGYKYKHLIDGKYRLVKELDNPNAIEQWHSLVESAKKLAMSFKKYQHALVELSSVGEVILGNKKALIGINFIADASGHVSMVFNFNKVESRDLSIPLQLEDIGISKIDEYKALLSQKSGIILISGRTGSGKSTTLNLSANHIIKSMPKTYIKNVEADNIESHDAAFSRAIKQSMKANADIVVIGEIRTQEIAMQAIDAAESGALVFATMHGHSINEALINFGMLVQDIPAIEKNLLGILVQNIASKTCTNCQGGGCIKCNDTGKNGKAIISELVEFSNVSNTKNMILGNQVETTWHTMFDDAINKHVNGIIGRKEMLNLYGYQFEKWERMTG